MSTDEQEHRAYYQSQPTRVATRDDETDDGMFEVRMPVATTGEVRNQGDDPLTREALAGMTQQIRERGIGVFFDHGFSGIGGSRYAASGRGGDWRDPELRDREDGESELVATATLMDPDGMSDATDELRSVLASVKEQATRGVTLASSIGWRDDDNYPGGVDLLEASLVGVPADPATTTNTPGVAAARAAVADIDVDDQTAERLVSRFRAVVAGPNATDQGSDARDAVPESDHDESGDPDTGRDDESEPSAREQFRAEVFERLDRQSERLDALEDDVYDADSSRSDSDGDDDAESAGGDDDGDESDDGGDAETQNADGELDIEAVVEDHRETLRAVRDGDVSLDEMDLGPAEEVTGTDDSQSVDADDEPRDTTDPQSDAGGWLS